MICAQSFFIVFILEKTLIIVRLCLKSVKSARPLGGGGGKGGLGVSKTNYSHPKSFVKLLKCNLARVNQTTLYLE